MKRAHNIIQISAPRGRAPTDEEFFAWAGDFPAQQLRAEWTDAPKPDLRPVPVLPSRASGLRRLAMRVYRGCGLPFTEAAVISLAPFWRVWPNGEVKPLLRWCEGDLLATLEGAAHICDLGSLGRVCVGDNTEADFAGKALSRLRLLEAALVAADHAAAVKWAEDVTEWLSLHRIEFGDWGGDIAYARRQGVGLPEARQRAADRKRWEALPRREEWRALASEIWRKNPTLSSTLEVAKRVSKSSSGAPNTIRKHIADLNPSRSDRVK